MPKLKLTIEIVYEVNPEHYGTLNPSEMAQIDESNFRDGYASMVDLIQRSAGSVVATVSVESP
jgi:hypothetical protein